MTQQAKLPQDARTGIPWVMCNFTSLPCIISLHTIHALRKQSARYAGNSLAVFVFIPRALFIVTHPRYVTITVSEELMFILEFTVANTIHF